PRLGLWLALVLVLVATAVAGAGASDMSQASMRHLLLVSSDCSGTLPLYAVSLDDRALMPMINEPTMESLEAPSTVPINYVTTFITSSYVLQPTTFEPNLGSEDVAASSPDGQCLVFERVNDDDHSQLWLTRRDGSELHRLTHGAFDELATWTPEDDLVFNRAA